jgi:hypothetical protein
LGLFALEAGTSICFAASRPTVVHSPIKVLSSSPLPALTRQFAKRKGWTGADGAYSIKLTAARTLWLFGDTWIGQIKNGKRVGSTLINNSAAWQDTNKPRASFRFFWNEKQAKPASLIESDKPDTWVWPGDGALVDGKLYIFLHVISRKPHDPSIWGFEGTGDELLQVDNPLDPPVSWRSHRQALPRDMQFGNATIFDADHGFLYIFGENHSSPQPPFGHFIVLARLNRHALNDLDLHSIEYWCSGVTGANAIGFNRANSDPKFDASNSASRNHWSGKLDNPVVLIPNGASEMTVSRVPGLSGYFATYTPIGLGNAVAVRHATKLTGPWSEPAKVYECPIDRGIFGYSAKAHPELARTNGELVVTYCQNTASLQANVDNPEIYRPRAISVRLRLRK